MIKLKQTRYFDKYYIQREFYEDSLPEQFFTDWYNKLAPDPGTEKSNWHHEASTGISHLLQHKDCPDWLRDIYSNNSRADRRFIAFFGNPSYTYRNVDKILNDKAQSISERFANDLVNKVNEIPFEYLNADNFMKCLGLLARNSFIIFEQGYKAINQDLVLNLIDEDPFIRNFGKWYYTQLNQESRDKISTIIRSTYRVFEPMLKESKQFSSYGNYIYQDMLEIIRVIISAKLEDRNSIILMNKGWVQKGVADFFNSSRVCRQDLQNVAKWLNDANIKLTQFTIISLKNENY